MKISIITICYNSEKEIEKTIKSIISQTYKNIEYIIIDGGSNDDTLNIINKYKQKYNITLISENDNGIYDAMNKGLDMATGKYVNFMNSGDYFYDANTIEYTLPFINNEDIIYGNTKVLYKNFNNIKNYHKPKYIWMGPVNHQSSFIKTSINKKYKYNINNKLVADFEFFLKVYYSGGVIKKIDKTIAIYSNDGISQKMSMQVIKDAHKTVKKYKKGIIIDIYYNLLKIKPFIKKYSSSKILKFLIKRNI